MSDEIEKLKQTLQARDNSLVHAVTEWNASKERVKHFERALARADESIVKLKTERHVQKIEMKQLSVQARESRHRLNEILNIADDERYCRS